MKAIKPIKHIEVKPAMSVDDLLKSMSACNVMGSGRLGRGADIMTAMWKDKDCAIFFGLAGAMVPGGMKLVIHDILKSGRISAFVTTGATLTHDIIEALGYHHFQGNSHVDDEKLNKEGWDRMWDSFMPNSVYEGLEAFFVKNWDALAQKPMNIREFLWTLGSLLPEKPESILRICYDNKIPVFCPGISDSGIGLMVWGRIAQGKKMQVDVFDDLREILSLSLQCKKKGIVYVGGGLPKNFCQQALQFGSGADYGVQITTDAPQWGGSSGAELREGISWGKLHPSAEFVDVFCDATIALPMLWAAVKTRFKA